MQRGGVTAVTLEPKNNARLLHHTQQPQVLIRPAHGQRGRHEDDIEATGRDFIVEAWHLEGEGFPPPLHMLVVDQRGEARHIRHKHAGRQDAHDPYL